MARQRIFLEVGTGNDWHGGDYTKAAIRAIEDALHHSSLVLLHSLSIDPATMQVEVMIGVQQPDRVDTERLKRAIPHGEVSVTVTRGGLDVPNSGPNDVSVIATAAIAVALDVAPSTGSTNRSASIG